jgi:hypothetical protein
MTKPRKRTYRIRNWGEYEAALKQRASLTFWISEQVTEQWVHRQKTGRRGATPVYTETAICRRHDATDISRVRTEASTPCPSPRVSRQSRHCKHYSTLQGEKQKDSSNPYPSMMGVELPEQHYTTLSRRLRGSESRDSQSLL